VSWLDLRWSQGIVIDQETCVAGSLVVQTLDALDLLESASDFVHTGNLGILKPSTVGLFRLLRPAVYGDYRTDQAIWGRGILIWSVQENS